MKRPLLPEDRVDPAIRDVISSNHRDIVDEVEAAVAGNAVVVVGMKQNPFPRRARKALTAAEIWSGWPTFPMIFVKGVLIGGAAEVQRLLDSGELARRLAAPADVPGGRAGNSAAAR